MPTAHAEAKQTIASNFDHAAPSNLEPFVADPRLPDIILTRDNLHLSRPTLFAIDCKNAAIRLGYAVVLGVAGCATPAGAVWNAVGIRYGVSRVA
jgi:hypothetical protein